MAPLNQLFSNLDAERGKREAWIAQAKRKVAEIAASGTCKKLLISEEDFSQKFLRFNFEENADLLKRIFPKAEILLFLRFQPDWLVSAYKQKIKHCPDLKIGQFLNYTGGLFHHDDSVNAIDAMGLDHSRLLSKYVHEYGKANVHVFFYENFKADKKGVVNQVAGVIGVENRTQSYTPVYKSDSALIIVARILAIKIMKSLFKGYHGPSPKRNSAKLPSLKEAWEKESLPTIMALVFRKARTRLWNRIKVANILDWDLLGRRQRRILEEFYREQNLNLLAYLGEATLPPQYLKKGEAAAILQNGAQSRTPVRSTGSLALPGDERVRRTTFR